MKVKRSIWMILGAFGIVLECFFKALTSILVLYWVNTLTELSQIQAIFIALGSIYWIVSGLVWRMKSK